MLFVSRAAALELETVKQSLELKVCLWGEQGFGFNRRGDESGQPGVRAGSLNLAR